MSSSNIHRFLSCLFLYVLLAHYNNKFTSFLSIFICLNLKLNEKDRTGQQGSSLALIINFLPYHIDLSGVLVWSS